MVNKYLECLAVEGNYSKARIGLLVLGIFSLSVFIWLIVLTVQLGNASKESAGGEPVTTTATTTNTTAWPPAPKGEWEDLGAGCCSDGNEHLLFGVSLKNFTDGNLDGCQMICLRTSKCKFINYGWNDGNKYCEGINSDASCKTLDTSHEGCGSGGDTGVHSYEFEKGPVTSQTTEKPATTPETPEPDTPSSTEAPKECKTKPTQAKDNPVPGSVCIFPFQYKEKSHDSCTKAGGDFFWCATTVDKKTTEMVPGKWGQCDDDCVKEVNWKGPTKKVWNNAQCTWAGFGGSKNLDQCKKDCIEKTGCTAIVYKKGTNCILRACTQPVPGPTFKKTGYEGYYLS